MKKHPEYGDYLLADIPGWCGEYWAQGSPIWGVFPEGDHFYRLDPAQGTTPKTCTFIGTTLCAWCIGVSHLMWLEEHKVWIVKYPC